MLLFWTAELPLSHPALPANVLYQRSTAAAHALHPLKTGKPAPPQTALCQLCLL